MIPKIKGRINLSGLINPFNVSNLWILGAFVVVLFFILKFIKSPILEYALGCWTIGFFGTIIWIQVLYTKNKARWIDFPPQIEIINGHRGRVTATGLPEKFYDGERITEVLRLMMTGYDENLVSDGKVNGKAADHDYTEYTPEEAEEWSKRHKEEIRKKRDTARKQIEEPSIISNES